MSRAFALIIFAYISLSPFSPTLAQENLSSITSINKGAALVGTDSQVGVTFGGVSIASVALATTIIVSLLALVFEDSNDATPTTPSTDQ